MTEQSELSEFPDAPPPYKQDNSIQALFDYVVEQAKPLVASTSRTSEESRSPETISPSDKGVSPEPVIKKPPESIKS
ncbi:1714_t:CDS:2, partial [Ambispora leptoticha]